VDGPTPSGDRPGRFGVLARLALDTRPLRDSRDFRNLWIGQALSTTGTMIASVAVPFQMYQLTHSTFAVGMLGLAALVPLLVVPLVGGAIADASDRRAVLIRTEIGLSAVAALFLANAALPHPQVWALFALEALYTAVYSLGRPAMSSLTPRLVADDQIAAASALQNVYWSLASVAGPAVGGILIATVGVPATFGIDLLTYSASLVALWALPRIPPAEDAIRLSVAAILEGFRYLRGRQALMGVFGIDTIAMVFGMPTALFPAFAADLGGGASTVGYLYAAPYAGAFLGTLVSGWTTHMRRQGLGVTIAAGAWGLAIAAVGLAQSLWLVLAMLAVAGGADFFSAVLRETMLMRATPDAMRGRIVGIEFAQVAGAPNLGNIEAGVVASLTSVRTSIVSGGAICVVGCILCAIALPKFLHYDSRNPHE